MKTWEKKLLSDLFSFFFFSLMALYILYFVLDFSLHSGRLFSYSKVDFSSLVVYYVHHFFLRWNFFISLSFLLATLKILFQKNLQNELIALFMAGISRKKLLRPPLILASTLLVFSLINEEFIYPHSYEFVDQFKTSHLRKKKDKKNNQLHVLFLSDGSKVVYQKKLPENETLFDVFWIVSEKEIWHMKTFNIQNDNPLGTYVDHLLQINGLFVKKESFVQHTFTTFPKGPVIVKGEEPSKDSLSLTQIFKRGYKSVFSTDKPSAFKAFFHKKIAVLFIPILIVLGIAPFCLTFSRNMKVFFVSLFALFGWIAFYTIIESAYILGAQNFLSPAWIVWGSFSPFLLISLYKFATLR